MLDRTKTLLDDLAERIAAEHEAVAAALQSALAHAIAAGELLIEAKRKVRHGQWLKWLNANCIVPERTASHYMFLAKSREKLCDQNGNVLPISVNEALHVLKNPWPWPGGESPSAAAGLSYSEWGENIPPGGAWRPGGMGWRGLPWGLFVHAFQTAIRLPQLKPPSPRAVVTAVRAGKTPGLTPAALREVIALLSRYADALDKEKPSRS